MNSEILRLVDTIHRDKEIDKEIIFQGIEAALLSAAKKKLGESEEARVAIDRETGEIKVFEADREIVVHDLGRLAAVQGKQVLFQKIREAERDQIYGEYIGKVGKLVSGVVQRVEGSSLIVNLGKVEGILPRSEQAPGEKFRVGERIKVLVKDIRKNTNRVKIALSRSSGNLVRALFELEVPEIADKVIEIMEIAREPGYRTKIAVTTYDQNVDCVGACVGVRGSRIKNIVDELFGEKIDIVRWNDSIEVLIMNALKPAEICSMDLDFETRKAIVYVKPDQQSLAIGKRGQNVRLASKLSKWELDIVTVSDEELEKLRREGLPSGEEKPAEKETADETSTETATATREAAATDAEVVEAALEDEGEAITEDEGEAITEDEGEAITEDEDEAITEDEDEAITEDEDEAITEDEAERQAPEEQTTPEDAGPDETESPEPEAGELSVSDGETSEERPSQEDGAGGGDLTPVPTSDGALDVSLTRDPESGPEAGESTSENVRE